MTPMQSLERQAGGLYVEVPNRPPLVFPLQHTAVNAYIAGNVARVEVTQTFANPFTKPLEATYIFPLPDQAAVDEMKLRLGDRTIKGSIKKRQEAQQLYEQAKRQGHAAGLLEQERDNIFTQSLANIQPGESIEVMLRYTASLAFAGGDYEFVFPMVVGPRYIPGLTIEDEQMGGGTAIAPLTCNQDTDRVPDASRLNAPTLPEESRSSHDISVTVTIDAGIPVQRVVSPSHQIQVEQEGQTLRVKLASADTLPNKDLILRYQVAGSNTQATILTQADERGGHFALYLIPALQYRPDNLVPKDVVFLIDTSGSQQGEPLWKCQELMRRFIQGLNPDDTFSIIDFSDTTRQLSPLPLPKTPQNQARAMYYIDQLQAGGGTEMLRGIRTVLHFPLVQPGRLRSIVLLTDGYIGNENQILAEVQQQLQPGNRLYCFGTGSSVNRFLLNRLAECGRGVSRIVRHDEPTTDVAEQFFRQINNPVLTNLHLRWEGTGEPPIMHPPTPPDLFAEQPLIIFGRKADRMAGKLHVSGIAAGGKRYQQTFHLEFETAGQSAIAQLWGRARIKDLMNHMMSGETKACVAAATHTALTYQLLSPYTAFVAISEEARVKPQEQTISVQVPVEMPEGVSPVSVFGGAAAGALLSRPTATMTGSLATATIIDSLLTFSEASTLPPSSEIEPSEIERCSMPPGGYKRKAVPPIETVGERLQVVSVAGFARREIDLLIERLQSIHYPLGFSGELTFEFQVANARVRQVVLDEQASMLKEGKETAIKKIRRMLLTWQPDPAINTMIRLTLCLQSA